jgi:hypothetical protein
MSGHIRIVQFLIIETSGVALFGVIFRLARNRKLSFRYVIGWISLSILLVAAGPLTFALAPMSRVLGITQGALISIVGLLIVLAICIQLSISISGLHERQRRLSEEISQLKNTVEFSVQK